MNVFDDLFLDLDFEAKSESKIVKEFIDFFEEDTKSF